MYSLIRSTVILASVTFLPAIAYSDSLFAWGFSSYAQTGDGTYNEHTTPYAISSLSAGVSLIAQGSLQSMAVKNGGLYMWGTGGNGTIGDGTGLPRPSPVAISGPLSSGVTAISAGNAQCLAVKGGAVYGWGDNTFGEVGNNSTTSVFSPVALGGVLSSGVTAVCAGDYNSYAIKGGALYGWGANFFGALGDGTTTSEHNSPIAIPSLSSNVTAISAQGSAAMALANNKLYIWGSNSHGELGDGGTTAHYLPTPFTTGPLASGVTAIASGGNFCLALKNGQVYSWGANNDGQLGNNSTVDNGFPTLVAGITSNISAIAANENSSYALGTDGTLWVWGYNLYGDLGITDSPELQLTPTELFAPEGSRFTGIAAGFESAMATDVPEPGSALLLALGSTLLLTRRPRFKLNRV